MMQLQALFYQVINMGIAASFLMLAVILLRPFLKRVPKWMVCALWGLVAIRLIFPVALESRWSVIPAWRVGNAAQEETVASDVSMVNSQQEAVAAQKGSPESALMTQSGNGYVTDFNPLGQETNATQKNAEDGENISDTVTQVSDEENLERSEQTQEMTTETVEVALEDASAKEALHKNLMGVLQVVGCCIWFIGMLFSMLYGLLGYVKLGCKVSYAEYYDDYEGVKVFTCSSIAEPFVFGLLRPSIYLPDDLAEANREIVLCHELAHVKRGDYLWKPLGYLILCIYWFHPLCWVSYILFCRDVEMACDEKATHHLDDEERARYCQALLNMSSGKKNSPIGTVTFGENGTKSRIDAILNYKKPSFWAIVLGVLAVASFCVFFMTNPKKNQEELENTTEVESLVQTDPTNDNNTQESDEQGPATDNPVIENHGGKTAWDEEGIHVEEFYQKKDGTILTSYEIDEDGTLWGQGENRYGQLGLGTKDQKKHDTKVEIAEHVVHVDYSQEGFVIYLTEEHKLYGIGNGGSGALLAFVGIDYSSYLSPEAYAVCSPVLLKENVQIAWCGRGDVACLLEDGSIWIWGTIGIRGRSEFIAQEEPMKVLEDALLVTGGAYNHAALLEDGSVWTWGYNYAGNCGVPDEMIVTTPQKVADEVVRVWTSVEREHPYLADMPYVNAKELENTLIEKTDHTLWICGARVGKTQKTLPVYYEAYDYTLTCTHEFLPYQPFDYDDDGVADDLSIAFSRDKYASLNAFAKFLSGDVNIRNAEQEARGFFGGFQFALEHEYALEYLIMDLDGDGVGELLLQTVNDPITFSAVFHYNKGKVDCWDSDSGEGAVWQYPLSDGSMVIQRDESGSESYTVFRYLNGEHEEKSRFYAHLSKWGDGDELPCPYYTMQFALSESMEEVDQKTYEKAIKECITDRMLSRDAWTKLTITKQNAVQSQAVFSYYVDCDEATTRALKARLESYFANANLFYYDQGHVDAAWYWAAEMLYLQGKATEIDGNAVVNLEEAKQLLQDWFDAPEGSETCLEKERPREGATYPIALDNEKLLFHHTEQSEKLSFEFQWTVKRGDQYFIGGVLTRTTNEERRQAFTAVLIGDDGEYRINRLYPEGHGPNNQGLAGPASEEFTKRASSVWNQVERAKTQNNASLNALSTADQMQVEELLTYVFGDPKIASFNQENFYSATAFSTQKMIRTELRKLDYHTVADYYTISVEDFAAWMGERFVVPEDFAAQIKQSQNDGSLIRVVNGKMVFWFFTPSGAEPFVIDGAKEEDGQWLVYGHNPLLTEAPLKYEAEKPYFEFAAVLTQNDAGQFLLKEFYLK
ncbi:MAG: hypothetical protein II477_12570 [Lachnospiraceae bacterium]|nr:hypothetical protein [Lachnospiraceae bacterium]